MAGKSYPLSVIISAVDRISGPMRAIAARMKGFSQSVNNRLGMAQFQRGIKDAGTHFRKAGDAFGYIGRMARTAAVAIGAAGAAAAFSVKAFADYASEFQDLSLQTAISAETLQGWSFGAQQSGVEAAQFSNTLRIFAKNLGAAMAGTGAAKPVLKAMRIAFKDANGNLRTTADLLPEIADKIAKIKNPAIQAAAAARIFGKSGVQLLPWLKLGSAGIAELEKRSKQLGGTLSNETILAGEAFGDQLAEVSLAAKGVRNTLVGALLPALSTLATKTTEAIVQNLPQIKEWASAFGDKLPERIRGIATGFEDISSAISPLIGFLSSLNDTFGLMNLAIGIMATMIAAKLIIGIAALAQAFAALGVAMGATPIGLIIVGLGAIVLAGLAIYRNWDRIAKWWGEKMAGIEETVRRLAYVFKLMNPFGWLADSAKRVGESIKQYIPDWMRNIGSGLGRLDRYQGAAAVGSAPKQQVHVQVDMKGLPKGTDVKTQSAGGANFTVNQGFAQGTW